MLFHEYKIDCENEAHESGEMIPMKLLSLEENHSKEGEYCQRDSFLNHLKLHEGERAAVAMKTHTVGRHLTEIFEQRYTPRNEDNDHEGCGI